MSGGAVCRCRYGKGRQRLRHWRVVDRMCNWSAFNGGEQTPSAYSSLRCQMCDAMWRTKANYVANVSDMTATERRQWLRGTS